MDEVNQDQVKRIHALLDAFAIVGGGLFLHESTIAHLAHAVIEWTAARKLKIGAKLNTAHGRTYESWDVYLDTAGNVIHVFPTKIGLLGNVDSLESKIAKIRDEADKRIRDLVDAEMGKQP